MFTIEYVDLVFEVIDQHIRVMHWDLEIGFLSYVTKYVFIVVESLVKH
jgi:hypothetical protein